MWPGEDPAILSAPGSRRGFRRDRPGFERHRMVPEQFSLRGVLREPRAAADRTFAVQVRVRVCDFRLLAFFRIESARLVAGTRAGDASWCHSRTDRSRQACPA